MISIKTRMFSCVTYSRSNKGQSDSIDIRHFHPNIHVGKFLSFFQLFRLLKLLVTC